MKLVDETRTMIVYEAPHRLVRTLRELLERLGDRRITVCRELTKKHETAFATTLGEALAYYEAMSQRVSVCLSLKEKAARNFDKKKLRKWEEMSGSGAYGLLYGSRD